MKLNPINSRFRVPLGGVILMAMLAGLPARADYPSTVLSQGPAGYWRLSETTQPAVVTTTPNKGSLAGADGAYNNDPLRGLPGPFTGSVSVGLDGSSQSITTPYQPGLNPNTFSVEFWLNPKYTTYPSSVAYVGSSFHASTTAPGRSGWYFAQDNGTTFGHGNSYVFRMFAQPGAGSTTPSITLWTPVNDSGTWMHVVITFDGTTATIYTNGAVSMSGAPTGTPNFVANVDGQTSFGMRSDGSAATASLPWPGQQAEVAMYTGALSQARVSAHYTAATSASTYATAVQADSPVLWYRFQEPASAVAGNSSTLGSSLNGKYAYGTTPGQAGPRLAAYPGFEAGNNSVGVPGNTGNNPGASVSVPALNLNTNTVTMTAWVKATTDQEGNYAGIVVCHAGTTDSGLIIDFNGGLGVSYVWAGANSWSPSGDSGLPTLPLNDWAYVALVVQPNQAAIYLCASNNAAGFAGVTNPFVSLHTSQAFDGATLFGSDAGSPTYSFTGNIDEVAIFNRSLGEGELYTQYGAAVGGLKPKLFGDIQGPSGSVAAGDPITLTVDAGGTPPLTFIWRTNGVAAYTTTSNTLVVGTSRLADTGNYDVIISNAQGTATSSSVGVTVVTPSQPQITQLIGYLSRTLYPTGTLNMAVSATGGGLKYQWYKNTQAIATGTASSFTIAHVTTADAGSYSFSVTNIVGSLTSGPPVVVTIPSVTAGSYEATIVKSGPEAWWRLDERSGTNMFDGMGRHDGVYTNAAGSGSLPTLGVSGALVGNTNTAASFSSTSMGIGIVPYSPALNPSKWSAEGWVKTSLTTGNQAAFGLSFNNAGWWLQAAAGWWAGSSFQGTWGNNANANTAARIVPDQWSYVVLNYDAGQKGSDGNLYPWTLYVNGQTDGYIWRTATAGNDGPFTIGAQGVSPTTIASMFFDGQVDEVALYGGRTLTGTEITDHYAARGTPFVPVTFTTPLLSQTVTTGKSVTFTTTVVGTTNISLQWYKGTALIPGATGLTYSITNTALSDTATYTLWGTNSGSTNSISATLNVISPVAYANVTNNLVLHLTMDSDYADSSGRGNNATAPAGSPPFIAGQVGQAIHVATTPGNNYLLVNNSQDLQFDIGDSFSVSFWLRYTTSFGDVPIIGNATNSTYQLGWVFTEDGGKLEYSLTSTANSGAYIADPVAASPLINNGAWHQVLGVVDRSSQYAFAYVDGVLAGKWSIAGMGSMYWGNQIAIGQDPTGNYGTATFDLDDVGIWRQALTPLDAAQIESAGRAGNSFNTVGAQPITITTTRSGANVTVHYSAGTLYSSTNVTAGAQWNPVPNANPPAYTFTPGGTNTYYRVK
jgi:hypothetical protein